MGSSGDDGYRLLNEYANGFMVSQVLFAACELGVFDLLAEAPGPLDVAAVAAGVAASSHGTELLLDTCVSLKLLKVETRAGKGEYGCVLSRGLCTPLLWTLARIFTLFTSVALHARSEGERLQFMQALQDVWSVNGRSVLTAFDLSGFPRMCDLGGNWLGLLPGACYIPAHSSVSGDFFKDPLPEADLYILARILHDWADGKCSHLLERVYHTCKPGGGILVIESLLDEDRRGPLLTQLYSLNMLVQTEGQERSPTHYHMLLSSAGFRDFQFKKTGAIYDAILVRK
uniref:Acetylserotonin O-methyltransferase n=1 Tax=Colobus angolensis palliatus TaxID=336983 RepID=A0A2K5K7T8_COLAP